MCVVCVSLCVVSIKLRHNVAKISLATFVRFSFLVAELLAVSLQHKTAFCFHFSAVSGSVARYSKVTLRPLLCFVYFLRCKGLNRHYRRKLDYKRPIKAIFRLNGSQFD